MADVVVTDIPDRSRFEGSVDGRAAGFAQYHREGDVMVMPHTEVFPEFEGQGVGGAIVRHALEAFRSQGLGVDPQCPFVAAWIQRHPEFADLVAQA